MDCFYCEICDKRFSGPAPYKQHIDSDKHQKKVKTHELLKKSQNYHADGSEGALGLSESFTAALSFSGDGCELSLVKCSICNCTFSGPECAETHYEGKRHKKELSKRQILEELKKKGAISDECLNSSQQTTDGPRNSSIIASGIEMVGANTPLIPLFKSQSEGEGSVQIDCAKEPSGAAESEMESLKCDCCGILLFKDLESAIEHYETEHHRKKKTAWKSV